MPQKPSIPKGTRDFSPPEIARRNYILEIVRKHFTLFGFEPIETPSFENYSTLMGKYGDEGDRLIFKLLNSGDFISKVDDVTYSSKNSNSLTPKISDKALRYDLTVPFARYVVMHQNEIIFPFKRYQIQPVWRADRPQRGRFREFYQCDADVIGANSLLQEVELIQLYDAVFHELGFKEVTIKLNNRKILAAIAHFIGAEHQLTNFTVALDKLDKMGIDAVKAEMIGKGISESAVARAEPLFSFSGTNEQKLERLDGLLKESQLGIEGASEIKFLIDTFKESPPKCVKLEIDITLARGLNYYTGAIFEVEAPKGVPMGSIGGGGRYDDLTGIFGLKDVSGVGISFGLDRIYLVMEELGLFPESLDQSIKVLCVNFGDDEAAIALRLVTKLREAGIPSDMYPTKAKMQKQLKYANNRNIPYVILIGAEELQDKAFVVKDMAKGDQKRYELAKFDNFIAQLTAV